MFLIIFFGFWSNLGEGFVITTAAVTNNEVMDMPYWTNTAMREVGDAEQESKITKTRELMWNRSQTTDKRDKLNLEENSLVLFNDLYLMSRC